MRFRPGLCQPSPLCVSRRWLVATLGSPYATAHMQAQARLRLRTAPSTPAHQARPSPSQASDQSVPWRPTTGSISPLQFTPRAVGCNPIAELVPRRAASQPHEEEGGALDPTSWAALSARPGGGQAEGLSPKRRGEDRRPLCVCASMGVGAVVGRGTGHPGLQKQKHKHYRSGWQHRRPSQQSIVCLCPVPEADPSPLLPWAFPKPAMGFSTFTGRPRTPSSANCPRQWPLAAPAAQPTHNGQ